MVAELCFVSTHFHVPQKYSRADRVGSFHHSLEQGRGTGFFRESASDELVRAFGLLAGDFDGNGIVNRADLKAIKKRFTKPKVALARLADVDGNGIVNQADFDRATANLGRRLK